MTRKNRPSEKKTDLRPPGRGKDKVVVLAEPYWQEGHFETQMQLFLSLILPQGFRVMVLCAGPEVVRAWVMKEFPDDQESFFADYYYLGDEDGLRTIKTGRAWDHLARAVERAEVRSGWRADLVFITFVDAFINYSFRSRGPGRRFQYPWVGLYFLPGFFRHRGGLLKRLIQRIDYSLVNHMKNCRGLGILDEGVQTPMQAVLSRKKLVVFPDVTDERLPDVPLKNLDRIREEAGDRPIFGLIGVLHKRKGLISFLRGMAAMAPEKAYFLVVGHLPMGDYTEEEEREIQGLLVTLNSGRGRGILGYMEDPTVFNAYIALCDVLFLAYEGFYHSSGILTKAAVFEKPVIASKGYCMGERVEKFRMGLTVSEGHEDEILQAMTTLSEMSIRRRMTDEAQFSRYRESHNRGRLEEALNELLTMEGDVS